MLQYYVKKNNDIIAWKQKLRINENNKPSSEGSLLSVIYMHLYNIINTIWEL